jgi:DNA-binding winged helix-turn-helix (wHTH) protein
MPHIMPDPPLSFRSEVLQPLFRNLQSRESCTVVGCASMGKTRLIDFLMRPNVQEYYLGSDAGCTLILRADCNRLNDYSEWSVYELLLTALVEGCSLLPAAQSLRSQLIELRLPVLSNAANRTLAQRQLELALHILCQEHQFQVRFLLDEFDGIYKAISELGLAKLRALRDANKHHLSFVLFMRQPLERLRELAESESFFELFSRSVLSLGPYTPDDTEGMLAQLQARRRQELPEALRTQIGTLSGGHPGTIMALFDLGLQQPERVLSPNLMDLAAHPLILEECRKLWLGLQEDEQQGLADLAHGNTIDHDTQARLKLKGLVKPSNGTLKCFNPLIEQYARSIHATSPADMEDQISIDSANRIITVEGRAIKNLSPRVFKLISILYDREGEICTREHIMQALYDDDKNFDVYESALDTLVKRARKAIEPEPEKPRYLVTCWGIGYRLNRKPDTES